jgi:pilus assembly protein Flp/PilA
VTPCGDRGASAVEYGLLLTAIVAAIVTVVFLFGGHVVALYQSTCNTLYSNNCN